MRHDLTVLKRSTRLVLALAAAAAAEMGKSR
jgi:hypothetical protein